MFDLSCVQPDATIQNHTTRKPKVDDAKCWDPFDFRRNEEVDRNMVIRHLQRRLANLHLELANYKVQLKFM